MTSNSTEIKEIRSFGLIAFVFFAIFFSLSLWAGKEAPACVFGFLCLLGLCFILFPGPLAPVHRAWQKIAHFVGSMVTIGVLTLAYYVVITPSALIKRMFGGRPIQMKPDKDTTSYWVDRNEPAQPRERFNKRF